MTESERHYALAIACPLCGAPPGALCRITIGRWRGDPTPVPHAARRPPMLPDALRALRRPPRRAAIEPAFGVGYQVRM